jgi:hypothetical protein
MKKRAFTALAGTDNAFGRVFASSPAAISMVETLLLLVIMPTAELQNSGSRTNESRE